ncbi:hypothetical protein GCM10010168_32260 [Actinoplanes ianthinogenes]|uniref:DUF4097 domain-containing protein n=1 Tax=Actinoplanes ianthinogenes TaxID=122358 RepID=A0ABM7LM78_9ACTN|nr:DUF4097 family beta strand repeat-containing protein [Actinoplanes ianthinogenes]BCJ40367.1 hypothetical protein Aiant_10240 [Actinoplanes ianthinogenes]GGR11738.1 hypothetical protein GCM10010168_32260 [Actinoplanes ianthinogenes]
MMYEFDHLQPVTVALRAMAGSVEIDAGDHETVRVEVVPFTDSPASQQAAENTRVVLDGDTLSVTVPHAERWRWRRTPALRISIQVPAGSTLTGESAAADVRATGSYRDVSLRLASADAHIAELAGNVRMTGASGDLSVGRVGGSASLKTASGRINVGDVTGDVTVSTASGDIEVGSGGGSLNAGTASGRVTVGLLSQGKARIRTASGDVTVGVAPGTGVWLDLNSVGGHSVTDLASHGAEAPPSTGPGLDLRVRTASGDIRIHRATDRIAA